jgi:cytochrome c-type biogenesis protein
MPDHGIGDQLMREESSSLAPLQALSTSQRLLLALAGIVVLFLIVGSLNHSAGPNDFSFGIQTQPFFILAVLAFGGGMLSFVSPCTLPVLTAYFAFAFQSGRRQIAANTIAFMLGLGTTFSLLGAVGFALGRVLRQNEQLLLLMGGAFILFFGVISFLGRGFSGMQQTSGTGFSTTTQGSYLFGLTFAIGWSSCVGPILGSVLTLATRTTSVWNGMMLLFIYTLGLGLPLLIVSTFFGRMNRQSLFWRLLKGKGWDWETHQLVVALAWALAVWVVVASFAEYGFRHLDVFSGQEFTTGHSIGLLVVTLIGAALWVFTSSGQRRVVVHLHTTQLLSGGLFILIGVLMLAGNLATFNSLIPPDLAVWFIEIEEMFIALFN